MRRVYTAENVFDAQLVRDRLWQDGIAAVVHGTMLTGALGELPADTRPTVWIEDASLYERARQLVARFEREPTGIGEPWTCARCGEPNEPTFELCWSCGRPPGEASADAGRPPPSSRTE